MVGGNKIVPKWEDDNNDIPIPSTLEELKCSTQRMKHPGFGPDGPQTLQVPVTRSSPGERCP